MANSTENFRDPSLARMMSGISTRLGSKIDRSILHLLAKFGDDRSVDARRQETINKGVSVTLWKWMWHVEY